MDWLPDLPDFRDYTVEHYEIKPMFDKITIDPQQSVNELNNYEIVTDNFTPKLTLLEGDLDTQMKRVLNRENKTGLKEKKLKIDQ